MKETIYTIPINEAFETSAGCPVCLLEYSLERDALDYVMGAAMMEPDVRKQTNRLGFCSGHFDEMLKKGNRLSLALMLESYLMEQKSSLPSAKENPGSTCFVCSRRDGFMAAYYRNIYYMYEKDAAFREKLYSAPLCYRHLGALMTGAGSNMGRRTLAEFKEKLAVSANRRFDELLPLVTAFCRSFDHRFADKPLGDAKTAVEQTIAWLTGNS